MEPCWECAHPDRQADQLCFDCPRRSCDCINCAPEQYEPAYHAPSEFVAAQREERRRLLRRDQFDLPKLKKEDERWQRR
jgi:hypothetical protein